MGESRKVRKMRRWEISEKRAGAILDFISFVMCGGFARECLAVVCREMRVVILVDANVIEVKSPETADVSGTVVEKVKFEKA